MDSNDWRFQVLGALTTGLVAIVGAAVPLLVRAAIKYLDQRLQLDLTDAQERALSEVAVQSIAWVEEQSRKAISAGGRPSAPADKLALARSVARDLLTRRGHGSLTSDLDLGQAIEAALAQRPDRAAPRPPAVRPAPPRPPT